MAIYGVIRYIYGVIRYYRYKVERRGIKYQKFLYGICMAIYGVIRYIYGVIRYIRVKRDLMQFLSKIFISCNIGIYKKLKLGGKDYEK